jgi:hypothetical protein
MKKLDPRSVIIGFLVAVIGFMSMGATSADGNFETLTVQNLNLSDKGYLTISDNVGKVFMAISHDNQGGIVQMYNFEGETIYKLADMGEKGGFLALYEQNGKKSVRVGDHAMVVYEKGSGQPRLIADALNGYGKLSIINKFNKPSVIVGNGPNDDGLISLYDNEGQGTWRKSGRK